MLHLDLSSNEKINEKWTDWTQWNLGKHWDFQLVLRLPKNDKRVVYMHIDMYWLSSLEDLPCTTKTIDIQGNIWNKINSKFAETVSTLKQ